MRIVTYLDDTVSKAEFSRLKRKVTGAWNFFLSGEWSTLSGYSGRHEFHYATSFDNRYWSVLSVGFPNRVVAVAEVEGDVVREYLLARMLRAVSKAGGDSIDMIHRCAEDLDDDLLWETYISKSKDAS